ncbi:MAG: hypothetical protein ACRBFS_17405 [Aureispira sp.]
MEINIDYVLFGAAFIKNRDKNDTRLTKSLMRCGFSKKDAKKCAIFTPIAFGRFYLNLKYRNLTFGNLYSIDDTNENFSLLDDNIYRWASQLAENDFKNSILSKDACLEITNRSSEVQGISQAIFEGKSIDGAKFRTVIFV